MNERERTNPTDALRAGADGGGFLGLRVHAPPRGLRADETLMVEGAPARMAFLVQAGVLRCFRMTHDGRRHIIRFAFPGDLFGLGAQAQHRCSVEAASPARVVAAPRQVLQAAADQDARFKALMWESLSAKLAKHERAQLRLARLNAEERVADFLLELAEQPDLRSPGGCQIPMPRADIADHLGLTLETVSRVLHRFDRDGLIALSGPHSFGISRPGGLRRLASGDRDAAVGCAA